MLVVIVDDGRVSLGSPGPAARRNEQEAAFIEECEMRSEPAAFFLWQPTCSVSNARWPARRAGGLGTPAPDSSSLGPARSSRRVQGDSGCQTPPGSLRRCVSRSTAHWGSHTPGPPVVVIPPTAVVGGRSIWADAPAQAWGSKPRRLLSARLPALDTPSSPTPAPGVRPRATRVFCPARAKFYAKACDLSSMAVNGRSKW
jgi:hypothetical protein